MRPCPFRAEAKRLGKPKYQNGKPCKYGHVAPRWTGNSACTICALAIARRSKTRHFARVKTENAAYYAANKERIAALSAKWRRENPHRLRQISTAYYEANKADINAKSRLRKMEMRQACPNWADKKAIADVYAECARITAETGIEHHVDHIIPLRGSNVCGLHVHYNLQILPATENRSKGNRLDNVVESLSSRS